jgi:ParB-like chromosome segregation protein Spo0J
MDETHEQVTRWSNGQVRSLSLSHIGEHYGRYRLGDLETARVMQRSLKRYGQISPVVICDRAGNLELVDGFKRLAAARQTVGMSTLTARFLDLSESHAKAAIYGLNRVAGKVHELEEAWLVHALVREDGLQQQEVAELLGRHKSWVCRRLALLERLCDSAREDLRLGLLSSTVARQLTRLPAGNQQLVLETMRRESLCGNDVRGVVDLLMNCTSGAQQSYVLEQPREALSQNESKAVQGRDPRLSHAGNQFAKDLDIAIGRLVRMQSWFFTCGLAALSRVDRQIVIPHVQRFQRQASEAAERAKDFLQNLEGFPADECARA